MGHNFIFMSSSNLENAAPAANTKELDIKARQVADLFETIGQIKAGNPDARLSHAEIKLLSEINKESVAKFKQVLHAEATAQYKHFSGGEQLAHDNYWRGKEAEIDTVIASYQGELSKIKTGSRNDIVLLAEANKHLLGLKGQPASLSTSVSREPKEEIVDMPAPKNSVDELIAQNGVATAKLISETAKAPETTLNLNKKEKRSAKFVDEHFSEITKAVNTSANDSKKDYLMDILLHPTEKNIKAFQAEVGAKEDGEFGPTTLRALSTWAYGENTKSSTADSKKDQANSKDTKSGLVSTPADKAREEKAIADSLARLQSARNREVDDLLKLHPTEVPKKLTLKPIDPKSQSVHP